MSEIEGNSVGSGVGQAGKGTANTAETDAKVNAVGEPAIKLSLCIATYNRGALISRTLDALLEQMDASVELIVVDGASSDNTPAILQTYLARYPAVRYFREATNGGVDNDFDKSVMYARGSYCWLMSDDDLLLTGALQRVLDLLSGDPDLVIANAEVRTRDLDRVLKSRILQFEDDRVYEADDQERFFVDNAAYLSFIGCVVIRRDTWLSRDRKSFYGSLFIHVGVIFQPPGLIQIKVIAQPLVAIRYGNAMWTARGFEIWNAKWPSLVWSFDQFSPQARASVWPRFPARSLKNLLWYRALGAYGKAEYGRLIVSGLTGPEAWHAAWVAKLPATLVNTLVAFYCFIDPRADSALKLYDISLASCAGKATRLMARLRGL